MHGDEYDSGYLTHPPVENEQQEKAKEKPRRHYMLLAWLVLFAVSIVMAVAFLPRTMASIEESGVLPLLREWQSRSESAVSPDYRTVEAALFFPTSSSGDIQNVTLYQKRTGSGLYHDTMEALLAGPDRDALARGAITRIPSGTRLIGLTVSYSIAYIDLSEEFLAAFKNSASPMLPNPAYHQILHTMKKTGLRDIVLLIDGVPLKDVLEKM
ncbi:GerMN domain-containing protein [Parasphaerochaeta coccoides]|uniref:Lipoprotein LpqB, GerMN domain protein n=1 Tax=Parasphaerochaeta coccoides (strain ATCC BAA-1237 / DSM 17374 / SPN1) TaxID=760011 RepID=F4GKK1_PARC1|nr:GerMN domain-containing protein [Parasphaerochaeta coccoides]AEC02884.1 Lipoprotein LpqB, GerMN domain protein [Parasphaerochaeta coccoides DSM 17374]